MSENATALPLGIGARTIATIKRRLVRVPLSLDDALANCLPPFPELSGADGYLITSVPRPLIDDVRAGRPDLWSLLYQRYRRSFVALDTSFDLYMAGFSAKSRSTLKRKLRRFAVRSRGVIDVRCYRTPSEMAVFHELGRRVSALTYQERLLDAGLPAGADALVAMLDLAQADAARGWLLFLEGWPVAYLWSPACGDTLIYAHLGYDPAFADMSPGTVLQLEAIRMLMEERRFRLLDFTEGEGQHKNTFGTGGIDCADLLLLRRTPQNYVAGGTLHLFNSAVDITKNLVARARRSGTMRTINR